MPKSKLNAKSPSTGKLQVSKTAANIAKAMGATDPAKVSLGKSTDGKPIVNPEQTFAQQKELLQKFEAEVMGEQEENKGTKSEIRARNYEQMVGVLKHKLTALETAAKFRLFLCERDLDKSSTQCSKQAPKITDDLDDLNIQRAPREGVVKFQSAAHRDNLVSSDTVHVDATHLVVRTKQSTETGKKLEAQLEESFGNVNLRELKGKKNKGMNRQEKSKKSVRQKNEAKKQARIKLEKDLHANMENYVTRSVNDVEMKFSAPPAFEDEPRWPISVKWPPQNPLSQHPDNADGEMDPELLMLYAVERITLQSGESLFKWLTRQNMIQQYFVFLFWLVKLKFFQPDSTDHDEGFLLHCMSKDYVRIVELMANRSHAEYEKDYVFKFLPFIFSNAIFYAFYFLCPGSRHIYTRAFRKTILVQVVQIMHGVQLSQLSVKISWAKLFPDDVQEGAEEEGDDGGEIFPVQLAFSKRPRSANAYAQMHLMHHGHDNHANNRSAHALHAEPHLPMNATTVPSTPAPNTTRARGGIVAAEGANASSNNLASASTGNLAAVNALSGGAANGQLPPVTGLTRSSSAKGKSRSKEPAREGLPPSSTLNSSSSLLSVDTAGLGQSSGIAYLKSPATSPKKPGSAPNLTSSIPNEALIGKLPTVAPTERTMLKPPLEKPAGLQHWTIRQNKETIDAKEISPVMQQFLYQGSERGFRCAQPMARIAPVSWCVAGGSDTHRRRHIPKQLLDDISQKAAQSEKEYLDDIPKWRKRKMNTLKKINAACKQVLSSGQQSISRFSLDLIKQKRLHSKTDKDAPVASLEEIAGDGSNFLEKYANYEDENIEEFLESIGESL